MKGHMTPPPPPWTRVQVVRLKRRKVDQMKVAAEMKGNEGRFHRNQRRDQTTTVAFCFKGPVEARRWQRP